MIKQENNKKVLRRFCVLFCVCFAMVPISTWAATLYLMPQSQTIYQDDTFIVELRLDTEGEEINAVEANLNFPSNFLEVIDISKGNSILTLWVKEPIVESKGLISFAGGIPGGFEGDGLVGKITFLGKGIGRARVSFEEGSKVLLNDAQGTEAGLIFLEGNYQVVSRPAGLPVLNSPSNPDQNKWYPANSFEIHWQAKPQAEYSYILSRDPLMEPDEKPEELIEHLKWEKMEDGIYYFHLKERIPGEDWSEKISYRFMIDTRNPEEFKPEVGQDPSIFEGKYFLSFATTDETSGIDYYEILEADKRGFKRGTTQKAQWRIVESPHLLEDQELKSIIKVKVVDKAGNERISEITPPKKPFPYLTIISIFIGILIIIWVIYKILKFTRLGINKTNGEN